jgi:hypothetical protein
MERLAHGNTVVIAIQAEEAEDLAYALQSYLDRGGSGYHDRDKYLDELRIILCEGYAGTDIAGGR